MLLFFVLTGAVCYLAPTASDARTPVTHVSTQLTSALLIPPFPPHSHYRTKPCSAVGEGGVTMLKPPASPLPGQRRRKERASSSSASTCAGGIVFWSALAGAFYLLNCWSGVRVDEASETQSVFPSRLRRHEESSRPRYQMLATALRPSRRYVGGGLKKRLYRSSSCMLINASLWAP